VSLPVLLNPVTGDLQGGNGAYGYRTHPVTGKRGDFHGGDDVACPIGTPVRAPEPGTIVYAGWAGDGLAAARTGRCVILRGDWTGAHHYFGHNDHNLVHTGDRVEQGDLLAESGDTGNVTGPHVHVEIRPTRTLSTVDAVTWYAAHGVTLGTPSKATNPGDNDMKLTDRIPLAEGARDALDKRKDISLAGALQYAAAGGWLAMQHIANIARDVRAIRADVATIKKGLPK
jgi:murein DD-endopeptidase MepM/ murein hydrolase activator NlpD